MPTPGTNESRDEFIERCIPIVIEDGTAEDGTQGAAICNSMWEQRDKSEGKTMKRERKTFDAKVMKADEKTGIVDTIFAVMGNVDHGNDMIHPGAFAKTFAERGNQVLVLDQHNTDSITRSLGHPRAFREIGKDELPPELLMRHPDATGGAFASVQFNMKTAEGAGAFHRLDAGDISQWSFAYDALDVDFSEAVKDGESITIRNLRTLKLYEISPVLFGMNEATMTVAAKEVNTPSWVDFWASVGDKKSAMDKTKQEDGNMTVAIEGTIIEMFLKSTVRNGRLKAGRVLSARNATRINAAITSLVEALDSAGVELDGFTRTPTEPDEDEKDNDAPASEQAAKDDTQGAGPDVPPTLEIDRQKLLLRLEIAKQI